MVWLLVLLIFSKKVDNLMHYIYIYILFKLFWMSNKNVFSTEGTYQCTVASRCMPLSTKVLFLILLAWKISPQSALSSKFLKIFNISKVK